MFGKSYYHPNMSKGGLQYAVKRTKTGLGLVATTLEQLIPPLSGVVLNLHLLLHEQIQQNQPEVFSIKLSSN
jgi:hypothetical protein